MNTTLLYTITQHKIDTQRQWGTLRKIGLHVICRSYGLIAEIQDL